MPCPARTFAAPPDFAPAFIAIRQENTGYGIRFGLSEAEDALRHGPVFSTLPEALAWVDALDAARASDRQPSRSADQ